ncbi:MAG: F0F1 ATP synthase subunit A [Malacoplasma sp.]|nr:F0F1 ATP synthase subunit A [Malacoplasma sp.]
MKLLHNADFLVTRTNNLAASAFAAWNPLQYTSEITSIVLITLIIAGIAIYYHSAIKKLNPKEPPKGFAFLIFLFISTFKSLTIDVMGKEFVKLTPYFLTLFIYIFLSNIISVIGFANPTQLTTVTFELGLNTVIGSVILGIKYQKWSYLNRFVFKFYIHNKKTKKRYIIPYCFNPMGVVDIITPWISISLRLWANITAGSIILGLFYSIPMALFSDNPVYNTPGPEIILFSFFAIPLHLFLDWLVGFIQSFVFVILTMCYWNTATEIEDEYYAEKLKRKKELKALKKANLISSNSSVDLVNVGNLE